MVANRDQLQGSRSMQIIDGDKTLSLQFALFGVT
jgi:hypothetical protein